MRLFVLGDVTLDRIFSVDELPESGACRIALSSNTFFGGRGANIAIAASRLGISSAICSIAGKDFYASGYEAHFKKNKVDIENLKIVDEAETSCFFLYEDKKGRSYAFYHPNVDPHYDALTLDIEKLKSYDMVHFTLMHEKFAVRALRQMKSTDVIISASLGREIYMSSEKFLNLLIGECKYLFMNESEAEILMAKTESARFPEDGAFAITAGEKGSIICTVDRKIKIPAVKAGGKTINPIGAGDAYAAGFLYGILKKYELLTCGRIASVVASFAVEGHGAQSSLPSALQMKHRYLDAFGSALP